MKEKKYIIEWIGSVMIRYEEGNLEERTEALKQALEELRN